MPKVQLKSALSSLREPGDIADDLIAQLGGSEIPRLVTVFSSLPCDNAALNRAIRERLPEDTRIIGATTAGEIDRDGYHRKTVQMCSLSGDFEVGVGLGRGLSKDAMGAGLVAVAHACRELGIMPTDLDPRSNVGVVIDDGSQNKKEELLLGMMERNQSMTLVGGGAMAQGSGSKVRPAQIFFDGEAIEDAALVAFFSLGVRWSTIRSHWYEPTGKMLTITKVDDSCRRVLEIDGQPALKRYMDILGVGRDELEFGKPKGFAKNPTALHVGREYFIRAPWRVLDDDSIEFANLLEEGTELELMKAGDMVESARKAIQEELPRRIAHPQCALIFECSGRGAFTEALGKSEEISRVFAAAPPCGGFLSDFGVYCGFQINATLTILVFGDT